MTFKPGWHVYLAAPFFNDQQRELCSWVEQFDSYSLPIYSPRLDGGMLRPDSDTQEINSVFESNKNAIKVADFILAVVDDFDPGVIWEMGYGHARGKSILGYSDIPGRGLNVMLAGCCNLGFVNGRNDLRRIFEEHRQLRDGKAFPRNTWSGEIQ
jgi:nucleoside 2-deoxyribosyltransferase